MGLTLFVRELFAVFDTVTQREYVTSLLVDVRCEHDTFWSILPVEDAGKFCTVHFLPTVFEHSLFKLSSQDKLSVRFGILKFEIKEVGLGSCLIREELGCNGFDSSCDLELRFGILKQESADFDDTGVDGEDDLLSVKGDGEIVFSGPLVSECMLHEPACMFAVLDNETFSNIFSRKHMLSE